MQMEETLPQSAGTYSSPRNKVAVSIVMPSYNERENIEPLISELAIQDQICHFAFRVIVVDDDSPDGTAEHIKQIDWRYQFRVDCIHRIGRNGLSSAVVEGALLADSEWIAVMDCDGQHDPLDLREMYLLATTRQLDLVIGSRFLETEELDTHRGLRAVISKAGNSIGRLVCGLPLTDPLTGFFLIKRDLFLAAIPNIGRSGFKILLDILMFYRSAELKIAEKQINFRVRRTGDSKLSAEVIGGFLTQTAKLMTSRFIPTQIITYSIVGSVGVFVHLTVQSIFLAAGANFTMAHAIGTLIAMAGNFFLNNRLTFQRHALRGLALASGLLRYAACCSLGAMANIGVAALLNSNTDNPWVLSALCGVLTGTLFNYMAAKTFVWR